MSNRGQISPGDDGIHAALQLFLTGRIDESEKACRKVLQAHPKHADGLHLLAGICHQKGDTPRALELMQKAIRRRPSSAPFHANLGIMLTSLGRLEGALQAYGEAIRLDPSQAQNFLSRGNVYLRLQRYPEALIDYERAIVMAPSMAPPQTMRAVVLRQLGRLNEALAACNHAIQLDPNSAESVNCRGEVLLDQGKLQEALSDFEKALSLKPEFPEAFNNRGRLLTRMGRPIAALDDFENAIRINPDLISAHNNMGNVLKDRGDFAGARQAYRKVLRIKPDFPEAYSNDLFCMNYDPTVTDDELAVAHRNWGKRFGRADGVYTTWPNSPDPEKRLNVGFVSADFFSHPTGYFLQGTMSAVDRERLRLLSYSCNAREDDLTKRLRSLSDEWRLVVGLSNRELAEAVRADDVDILIDLAGHTHGTRLACFALRPSPVQVTWLGSCHTTGVRGMDYILLDPTYVPAGCEDWFTEEVVRLPDIRWIYTAPTYAPPVAPPPVLERGAITFGSFNNLTKVNTDVIKLWSRVLAAVPESRLMLSWRTLEEESECDRWRALFTAEGVSEDRLFLTRGPEKHMGVLGDYAQVDIALDPFPFSGCISTCEALWMGVPVVALPGTRPSSRQSLGFLTAAGLRDWVANDTDDYVRIASDLASDPDRLAALRREQRARLAASPMCDQPRFAGHLEQALRQMWRRWCEAHGK